MARTQISKRTRFEIFKRDGFTCQYCGAHPPEVVLQVDHIVAVSQGGTNATDNLVTACQPCNLGKAARSLSSAPQALRDKAEAIAEQEEQLRGYYEVMKAKHQRIDDEAWNIAETLEPGCSERGFDRSNLRSIKKFLEKLGFPEVEDSMDAAIAKFPRSTYTAFKYFCGICWSKIRELEK